MLLNQCIIDILREVDQIERELQEQDRLKKLNQKSQADPCMAEQSE